MRLVPDNLRGRVGTTDRASELLIWSFSTAVSGWSLRSITPRTLTIIAGLLSATSGVLWLGLFALRMVRLPKGSIQSPISNVQAPRPSVQVQRPMFKVESPISNGCNWPKAAFPKLYVLVGLKVICFSRRKPPRCVGLKYGLSLRRQSNAVRRYRGAWVTQTSDLGHWTLR